MRNYYIEKAAIVSLMSGLLISSAWAGNCEPRRNSLCLGAKMAGEKLVKADYSGTTLRNGDFSGADLSGANLKDVNLYNGKLVGANFSGADMTHINLFYADVTGANLTGANLENAQLESTDFSGANLTDANLSGALLRHTKFSKTVFCRTIMPDGTVNSGPNCAANKQDKPAAASASAKSNSENLQELEALGRLRDKGILTEQEFQEKKKAILERM